MPPIDLSAELPPERDDEPSSLRQDIFDELADHLECSLHREQVKTGDEELARRNVIQRFGNPASIARKLWLDAMWEKIIMQRLSFLMTGLMTAACIAMAVLLWQTVQQNRDLVASQQKAFAEQQAAWQLRMNELSASQQALAEKLAARSPVPETQEPSVWVPVEYRFTRGSLDGPPVPGVHMTLTADAANSTLGELTAVSDANGIAKFPQVHHGIYDWTMTLPEASPQGTHESRTDKISVEMGQPWNERVVCPAAVHQPVAVVPRLELPDDLRQVPVYLLLGPNLWNTVRGSRISMHRKVGAFSWEDQKLTASIIPEIPLTQYSATNQVIVTPTGALHPSRLSATGNSGRGGRGGALTSDYMVGTLLLDPQNQLPSLVWPDREYRPSELTAVIFSFASSRVAQLFRDVPRESLGLASNLATPGNSRAFIAYLKEANAAVLPVEQLDTVPDSRPENSRGAAPLDQSVRQFPRTRAQAAYYSKMDAGNFEIRWEETVPVTMWIKPSPAAVEQLRAVVLKNQDDFDFLKSRLPDIEAEVERTSVARGRRGFNPPAAPVESNAE